MHPRSTVTKSWCVTQPYACDARWSISAVEAAYERAVSAFNRRQMLMARATKAGAAPPKRGRGSMLMPLKRFDFWE